MYLGRVWAEGDDDWPAVVGNYSKASKNWGRLSRILSREWANPKVSGHFFKAVMQAMLMFGTETWVLNPMIEKEMDSFQHWVARRLTGRHPRRGGRGW